MSSPIGLSCEQQTQMISGPWGTVETRSIFQATDGDSNPIKPDRYPETGFSPIDLPRAVYERQIASDRSGHAAADGWIW